MTMDKEYLSLNQLMLELRVHPEIISDLLDSGALRPDKISAGGARLYFRRERLPEIRNLINPTI